MTDAMDEYIRLEAKMRGVSIAQVRREEDEAARELKHIELPRARLEAAAKRDYSNHPWLAGDQEKPW